MNQENRRDTRPDWFAGGIWTSEKCPSEDTSPGLKTNDSIESGMFDPDWWAMTRTSPATDHARISK